MLFNNLRMGFPLGLAGSAAAAVNLFTNGGFDTDTAWTKEAGWTISGGKAVAVTATSYIYQSPALTAGHTYQVVMTVTRTGGEVFFASISGDAAGTSRTSSGTFTESFVASAGDAASTFGFYGFNFSGTLDDVSITDIT